ncbi:hypothetical protein NPX13_g5914 [Xylaria arbuscula]|uniref:Azaphilone pigments biosynthesis cluster protein L N-terminal domain-containing protein n=1 Tax=Xylaria arbuscula TaxID=114810 RepID=A0A9W8NDP0_9PEZI|nr:hypothetical protein NPX13_g5914 [Xylaria arbuscula]
MADPLSTAASVVGIVVPALHGIRLLLDDLEKLSDVPETVKSLEGEIRLVEATIQSFLTITEPQWQALGTSIVEQSKTTLITCKESCEKFKADLLGWTRHSRDGKLSWQDRARVGFLKQNRIEAMSVQLRGYQGSLSLVASTATLHYSILNAHITKDIKASISEKALEIASSITSTDLQLATINTELDKLDLGVSASNISNKRYDQGTEQSTLGQERAVLESCLTLLEALKSKNEEGKEHAAQKERDQSISVTFGQNNYGLQQAVNHGSFSNLSFGGSPS